MRDNLRTSTALSARSMRDPAAPTAAPGDAASGPSVELLIRRGSPGGNNLVVVLGPNGSTGMLYSVPESLGCDWAPTSPGVINLSAWDPSIIGSEATPAGSENQARNRPSTAAGFDIGRILSSRGAASEIDSEADRYIREDECFRISGLSRTTRWRLERKHKFPQRRQLSDNAVGWLLSEVLTWRANRPAAIRSKLVEPCAP